MKERWKFWLPLGLMMVVFAITRWPGLMPQNFSAAYAMAFCAGVYFPPRTRWWLPLGTLFALDLLLNIFYYGVTPVDSYTVTKLGAFAALIFLGTRFRPRSSWLSLLSGGLLGALLFYLITGAKDHKLHNEATRCGANLVAYDDALLPQLPHLLEHALHID